MPKKNDNKSTKKIPSKTIAAATPVRQTSVPPKAQPAKRAITHEQIAKRAYEIYLSGTGGSADQNWMRAERELRAS